MSKVLNIEDYELAHKLCKAVYLKLSALIENECLSDLQVVLKRGRDVFKEELEGKENVEESFPLSISLNNCVGFYTREYFSESIRSEFEVIHPDDIVKIELGVMVNGARVHFGETFIAKLKGSTLPIRVMNRGENERIIKNLSKVAKKMCKSVVVEEDRIINDDISNFIAGECSKFDCYPVENTISYKSNTSDLEYEADTNQIILGFKRKLDELEEWIILDNPCCDIEEGDVYNLNIAIVSEREEFYTYNNKIYKQNEHLYSIPHPSHIYRLNGQTHSYRLKSVREFYNKVKKNHHLNAFDYSTLYVEDPKNRIGITNFLKEDIVTQYPVRYIKKTFTEDTIRPVFYKKCTFYRKDNKLCLIDS